MSRYRGSRCVTRSGARRGWALLRWAITGKLPVIGYVTVPDTAPLLSQAQLARLPGPHGGQPGARLSEGGGCEGGR